MMQMQPAPVMMMQQAPVAVIGMQQVNQLPADFVTGLCDCCADFNSCCEVFFCLCCQIGYQKEMISTNNRGMSLLWCCIPYLCSSFLGLQISTMILRADVRRRFGLIGEGDCGGCIKACCCPACSVCQTYREMSIRGAWPGGVCVSTPFVIPGMNPPPVAMMNAAPMLQMVQPMAQPTAYAHPAPLL